MNQGGAHELLCRMILLFLHDGFILFWVMYFCALRANAMTDIGSRIFLDIYVDLLPISFVIPDFFAKQANWQDTSQGLDFFFRQLLFGQIPDRRNPYLPSSIGKHLALDFYGESRAIFFLNRLPYRVAQSRTIFCFSHSPGPGGK